MEKTNDAVFLTLRVVREDEEVDAGGPGPRAEDGDPLGVSAKVADVLVEPAQGLDLVQEAVVPLCRLIAGAQEAWTRETQRPIRAAGHWENDLRVRCWQPGVFA